MVVNSGSSSLKLRVLDNRDAVIGQQDLAAERGEVDQSALAGALAKLPPADAVGHRIVHGGARYLSAVRLDDAVVRDLKSLSDLAPLHQPASLAAHAVVKRILPDTPAIACFDTAFHATLPAAAATYALPRAWRERWPLRRYGFHGLSHAYAARRAGELLKQPPDQLRVISCHLGAGASLCAIAEGRSVDTTMGFTPLEGLIMATRSGSVDPGLLLWLLEQHGFTPAAVAYALEHESGLFGLAGSADMREVILRAEATDRNATLALDVYVHRLRAGIAAMAIALDGFDVLVFTGGVGENAPLLRARTAAGLGALGVGLDATRNATVDEDTDIGAAAAPVRTLVINAREDLEIAGQVRSLFQGEPD